MSDLPVRDRVQAILTLADKTTPGVWKRWGMTVVAVQDGTNNVDNAVGVARTSMTIGGQPRPFDAEYIVAACNAFPDVAAALLEALDTIDKAANLLNEGTYDHDRSDCVCSSCLALRLLWQALNGDNE